MIDSMVEASLASAVEFQVVPSSEGNSKSTSGILGAGETNMRGVAVLELFSKTQEHHEIIPLQPRSFSNRREK